MFLQGLHVFSQSQPQNSHKWLEEVEVFSLASELGSALGLCNFTDADVGGETAY